MATKVKKAGTPHLLPRKKSNSPRKRIVGTRVHIKVQITVSRFLHGKEEAFENTNYIIEADVVNRLDVYYTLMREFGRCYGAIPMGYRFGSKEHYDDGSVGFAYYDVIIIEGARQANGFILNAPA